jgi:TatD DNase family protein
LTDEVFDGVYSGSKKHDPDRAQVLERAWQIGVEKIIITVGTIFDCAPASKICELDGELSWKLKAPGKHSQAISFIPERLFYTVGTHPTRCGEFLVSPDNYFGQLDHQIEENRSKVVAIGEIGLDYDRLHFCEPDVQKKYFEKQLELADKYELREFFSFGV